MKCTLKQALKLVLPALILAELLLVWSGVMGLRDALFVVAGLEALLLIFGAGNLVLILRRYQRGRSEGLDVWKALEDGLSVALPRTVARLILKEPRIFIALFRWTFRRVRLTENEFGYHRRSALREIVPLIIVATPMELVLVHVLAIAFSPWEWLKWVLLALEVYATLWLLGLYASLVTLPHRLEAAGLRLRYGVFAEGFVPYKDIESVELGSRKAPEYGDGLFHTPEEDALRVAAGGKTDVVLRLRTPRSATGFLKESAPASVFHIAADDPKPLAQALRQYLPEVTAGAAR